jgi:DUF4097 and DUF4098 domain-containing protein YvlB
MLRYVLTLLYAFSAVALGAVENLSKVNGSIDVDSGYIVGDVETVNGSISIGTDAAARDVETVNGKIRIEARGKARSAEMVNGGITVGEGALVDEGLSTVNGGMRLAQGAQVKGGLENVNGDLELRSAQVDGGIETVNGDIFIGTGSRVDGGIHVEENSGSWWRWKGKGSDNPRITIESGAIVNGPLHFEREVDLYVGEGVVLGPIEGVQPRRFEL